MKVKFGERHLDLGVPRVMGVLNMTPDSFSDGGNSFDGGKPSVSLALQNTAKMLEDGADFIDIGGESTRPGAAVVSLQEEMDRVLPVVEAVSAEFDTIISVDTSSPLVMSEALKFGVGLINDVRALTRDGAIAAVAGSNVAVSLMHMQGQPKNMQDDPCYSDVLDDVIGYLSERIDVCEKAGIDHERIIVDPGFGFGKTLEHNLLLMRSLERLDVLKCPSLIGVSRKSMIQMIIGDSLDDRLAGSLSLATIAAINGAKILRVHDVKQTAEMLKIVRAVYPV